MARPTFLRILTFILIVIFLGRAWSIGSRLFLPRVTFDSLLQHGIRNYQSGQIDQAFAYFQEATERRMSDPGAEYMLAQSLEAMGREDEAIIHYKRTLELSPSQAAPHYNLAVIYNRRKDYTAAIAELQRAVQLNRDFQGARFMLGGLYLETEQYAEAADELERIIRARNFPDRAFEIQVRSFLARTYTGMDEIAKAREQWQSVLRLDHTNQQAQEALSELR